MICTATTASCACVLDHGHTNHHECNCGGVWDYDNNGDFVVYSWPVQEGFYPHGRSAAKEPT